MTMSKIDNAKIDNALFNPVGAYQCLTSLGPNKDALAFYYGVMEKRKSDLHGMHWSPHWVVSRTPANVQHKIVKTQPHCSSDYSFLSISNKQQSLTLPQYSNTPQPLQLLNQHTFSEKKTAETIKELRNTAISKLNSMLVKK